MDAMDIDATLAAPVRGTKRGADDEPTTLDPGNEER
jgi:hypothetical protein